MTKMHTLMLLYGLFLGALSAATSELEYSQSRKVCSVPAGGTNATDDAPAIIEAFENCGRGGTVRFENTTYYVNSVMNISGLQDCTIDLQGTLVVCVFPFPRCCLSMQANLAVSQWSTDIEYWLNHSMPVGYQNQSTAFKLGGDRVLLDGHGHGTFDGNGAVWYHYAAGISNLAGRPHALTLDGLTNSRVTGVQFLRSQMW